MQWIRSVFGALFWLALVGVAAWGMGLDDLIRASISAGHLLDWVMGVLCLVWLIVLLKTPWDLYFQAHAVAFEMQRSKERQIPIAPGREAYVQTLRRRLGWLAIGAHLFSAALVAGVTYFAGGAVGYYFAVFYLVATAFRPALAGYVYLSAKLRALGQEVRYPREDVVEVRERLERQEQTLRDLAGLLERCREELRGETTARDAEDRDLRLRLQSLSREFESAVSRLTDNQEIIDGIQAFVRLVTRSGREPRPES